MMLDVVIVPLLSNSWQGCQFWNQTFTDEELEKVDVDEIRELFDQGPG